MCNILQLHRKSMSRDCNAVEREHRKRLWWSTFCMDRMASTQMGLLPNLQLDQMDLDYPSSDGLSPEDKTEFSDADLLKARAQLAIIQDVNASHVSQLGRDEALDIETVIGPALKRLDEWKQNLPAHLVLCSNTGLPVSSSISFIRSFANLHIRINQVSDCDSGPLTIYIMVSTTWNGQNTDIS